MARIKATGGSGHATQKAQGKKKTLKPPEL